MDKQIIYDDIGVKETNVRIESFIDEVDEESDYKKLNISVPAYVYIMLYKKGFFDRDFSIALSRSNCDAEFLQEKFTNEDKNNFEKMQRILGSIIDGDIDKN